MQRQTNTPVSQSINTLNSTQLNSTQWWKTKRNPHPKKEREKERKKERKKKKKKKH